MTETVEKATSLIWDRLTKLADRMSPPIRRAFMLVMDQIRNQIPVRALIAAIEEGDVIKAADLILGPQTASLDIWAPLVHSTREALMHVGAKSLADAAIFVGSDRLGPVVAVSFNIANPRTFDAIQRNDLRLIREIAEPTRQGIRSYLMEQIHNGVNPRSLITQLAGRVGEDGRRTGGIIGLTERQAQAVRNFRTMLETGDSETLNRALRDRRFDPEIKRALREGIPLDSKRIDFLVERYESRYLAYRAETIARTESLAMQAEGQRAGWDQAIERGAISSGNVQKRWATAHDERVRPGITVSAKGVVRQTLGFGLDHNHRQMNGQVVRYDDYFVAPDSGEQTWGAPHGVNCRCVTFIKPIPGRS